MQAAAEDAIPPKNQRLFRLLWIWAWVREEDGEFMVKWVGLKGGQIGRWLGEVGTVRGQGSQKGVGYIYLHQTRGNDGHDVGVDESGGGVVVVVFLWLAGTCLQ